VDLPPLLADVIAQLVDDEPGVEVVARVTGEDLESTVRRTRADVVVLPAARPEMPASGRKLLEDRAGLRVVGLVDHARSGVVGRLDVHVRHLEELSKSTLVEAFTGNDAGHQVDPPDAADTREAGSR
jgi:hypothetical protein